MSKEKTSPESGTSTDNSQQKKEPARSLLHRHGFALILIIAAALLAAASSWLSYRFHHNVGDLADDVKQLTATVIQLQQQVTEQGEQLRTVKSANGTLQHRLLAKENPGRWQIAEALYFTRLANDSLQFQHDIPIAKQLLNMADKRLLDSGETDVAALRQQLAEKIAQLNALPQVDIVGLYSKLTVLADSIAQLTPLPEIKALQKATSQQTKTEEEPTAEAEKISWRQGLRDSMKQVWQLIIIQRRDTPIEPLLTNQQYQQLNHSLLLLVRQAQWALLYRQPDIYHSSLQQVATLLKHYYGSNSQQIKPLLATITELDSVNVAVTAPSLAQIIDALSATISNYHQQQPTMRRHVASTSQPQARLPSTASTKEASSS